MEMRFHLQFAHLINLGRVIMNHKKFIRKAKGEVYVPRRQLNYVWIIMKANYNGIPYDLKRFQENKVYQTTGFIPGFCVQMHE